VPVDLYFANWAQLDGAVRGLWVVVGDAEHKLPLTAEDAARTEEILHTYGPQRRAGAEQAAAARARGDRTFTMELDLPERASDDLEHLLSLLDGVNRLVIEQDLALPASPEMRSFRHGLIAQIAAQLRAADDST
jgi:hypothetical protein